MHVLLVSADLMLVARVEGAVRLRQGRLHVTHEIEGLGERCAAESPAIVIFDLRLPKFDIDAVVASLRASVDVAPLIVACAPHVHEASLEAARRAGCDKVLSRGQIDREIDALIAQVCS